MTNRVPSRPLVPEPALLLHFRVSPQVLGPLGTEQLSDPALAVLELVKNSWDADASIVRISIQSQTPLAQIVVTDDGHGMTAEEFRSRWLVIGSSHKRGTATSENGKRTLIGEKGLGRLATFALGRTVTIESARKGTTGLSATIDWSALSKAEALEDYTVTLEERTRPHGTEVQIRDLIPGWSEEHTQFLVTHAQFLTSVPGESFKISLSVDGKRQVLEDPTEAISRLAEGELEMEISQNGAPRVIRCQIDRTDMTNAAFREMKDTQKDKRLSGARISLKFFRRDTAARRLGNVLERNVVSSVLERYQGLRIFRDGINVPPYGLSGNDWAGLEKQRTSTGGPTMVPGNSQLVGEVHLSRRQHPHFVVTAGRSGFSDQSILSALAHYVRWAVRELGTARRAKILAIPDGETVPPRVDERASSDATNGMAQVRDELRTITHDRIIQSNPHLRRSVENLAHNVLQELGQQEDTLRLYAQLASTGIAATSFAHELRAEFDVVSEGLDQMSTGRSRPDPELLRLLNESWARIRSFAGLFKVVPVKSRRRRRLLSAAELKASADTILELAPPENVHVDSIAPKRPVRLVPAEFDSILLNLVSNAVKAIASSQHRTTGDILIRLESVGSDLRIKVADNGCGVSKKVSTIMFEPLEGTFSEGTGMGLPIVRFISNRYDGDAYLNPSPPKEYETEFVVVLRNVVE